MTRHEAQSDGGGGGGGGGGDDDGDDEVKQVNKYDASAIKATLDDALADYLVDERLYVEDHQVSDYKLVVGFAACVCAAVAQLWPFLVDDNTTVVKGAIAAFVLCMVALQLVISYGEGGHIFVGYKANGNRVAVSTELERYGEAYTVRVVANKGDDAERDGITLSRSIGRWFDVDGRFAEDAFVADVAPLVEQHERRARGGGSSGGGGGGSSSSSSSKKRQ